MENNPEVVETGREVSLVEARLGLTWPLDCKGVTQFSFGIDGELDMNLVETIAEHNGDTQWRNRIQLLVRQDSSSHQQPQHEMVS